MTIVHRTAAAQVFNVPLMIDSGKAAAILSGLGDRFADGGVTLIGADAVDHIAFQAGRPSMGRLGDLFGRNLDARGYGDGILQVIENVAVIAVEGTLVHKGRWLNTNSGETSYEGIATQVTRARRMAADGRIKGVVFEVDSFGGQAAGAFDVAQMIADLSREIPTIAILTDYALSAGYLLASATRQIVMPHSGAAGSIGVILLHADMTRQLENDGLKVTVIHSGVHKADGHPALSLSPEVLAEAKARLDAQRENFAEAVASFRGKRLTKAAAMETEAQTYSGLDAQKVGLADAVMRPSEAFDCFISEVNRPSRSAGRKSPAQMRSDQTQEQAMSNPTGLAAIRAAAEPSESNAAPTDHAAAFAQARAEGEMAGAQIARNDAVAQERTRMSAILGSAEAKGRESLAQHLAFNTSMSAEDAVATLAKASVEQVSSSSRLDGNVPAPVVSSDPPPQEQGAGLAAAVQRMVGK